jgi:hypothetical protein
MMGLEPTTLGTTNRCSNQLSYIYRFVRRTPSEENAKIEISARFAKSFLGLVNKGCKCCKSCKC